MSKQKNAFTLIEVIISVIILSGAILYVLKVHSQTRDDIIYITQRDRYTLQDTLFLTDKTLKYHKENKNAYDIIEEKFKVEKYKSREILKKIKRDIFIPDEINLNKDDEIQMPFNVKIQEIKLKDKYSSYYFHFGIDAL